MTERVWHIEIDRDSRYETTTRLYCGRPLSEVAPYFLSVGAIVKHFHKVNVCKHCWNKMTVGLNLCEDKHE